MRSGTDGQGPTIMGETQGHAPLSGGRPGMARRQTSSHAPTDGQTGGTTPRTFPDPQGLIVLTHYSQ